MDMTGEWVGTSRKVLPRPRGSTLVLFFNFCLVITFEFFSEFVGRLSTHRGHDVACTLNDRGRTEGSSP